MRFDTQTRPSKIIRVNYITFRVVPEGGVFVLLVAPDVVAEVGLAKDVVRVGGGRAEAGLRATPVIATLGNIQNFVLA